MEEVAARRKLQRGNYQVFEKAAEEVWSVKISRCGAQEVRGDSVLEQFVKVSTFTIPKTKLDFPTTRIPITLIFCLK